METRTGVTFKQWVEILLENHVRYKDWGFLITGEDEGNLFLQVRFVAPDTSTGEPEVQLGRKWLVENGASATEVVQTAFLAVQRAEMHEIAELFTYRGATIFNRHLSVDELAKISDRVG